MKHLDFETEKARYLARSSKVIYDKSAFIGGAHKEQYVDVYGCAENGMVFIQKASCPDFDPSTRYDDWTPEQHSTEFDASFDYGMSSTYSSGVKVKHGRGHWMRGKPVYR